MRHFGWVAFLATLALASAAHAAPEPDDSRPLPRVGGITPQSRIEPRLSAVATNLAGRAVEVRCWSPADWQRLDQEWRDFRGTGLGGVDGYVLKSARDRLHLSPRACAALAAFIYATARPTDQSPAKRDRLASSLLTLTHESAHSRGIDDEQVAECRGVQLVRPVARLLGASKQYAAFIARTAWNRSYGGPYGRLSTSACRNGGRLDIHPATSNWP